MKMALVVLISFHGPEDRHIWWPISRLNRQWDRMFCLKNYVTGSGKGGVGVLIDFLSYGMQYETTL